MPEWGSNDPHLFDLGVLAAEENAKLDSRCRELGIRGFSKMNRQQKKDAILDAMFGTDQNNN